MRCFEVCKTSELPAREYEVSLFASCKKNQKAHQRFANLWTPGTIQSSVEKIQQSFPAARAETGFAYKTPAKRL